MPSRSIQAAIFTLLYFSVMASGSASPWAEVGDNQLRSDIEYLQAAGALDEVTTQWPLPWSSLRQDIAAANVAGQSASILAALQRLGSRADAATAPGIVAWENLDATNKPTVVYGFDSMSRGEGQAQLSLEGTSGPFSGRISLGAITNNYRGNGTKLMADGSYGALRLGDVLVYLGYLDHWWGPGQISALQLSNNARPMPQVGIERAQTAASSLPVLNWLGPWQAEFLLGYLDGPRRQPDSYYSAARLTIHPIKGFEAAIARTEEFCGQGHKCVPLRDYFHFANNPLDVNNTNDELTFDFKYSDRLGGLPYQVYMQLMNEDYSWFDHSGTSHLFGASIFIPTSGNPAKLTGRILRRRCRI